MAIWSGKDATKKFQVKVKVVRLEIEELMIKEKKKKKKKSSSVKLGVEVNWEGSLKTGFSSMYKKSNKQVPKFCCKEIELNFELGDSIIEWNDEFDHVCNLSLISKDANLFASSMVFFHLLYGENDQESSSLSRARMQVIGKASLNLGELASQTEGSVEQKLPISFEVDGVAMEAKLLVVVNFIEMRNSNSHSRTMSRDSIGMDGNSGDLASMLRRVKSQGAALAQEKPKKNKLPFFSKQLSWKSKGESSTTLKSDQSGYVVVASSNRGGESSAVTELGGTPSSEAQLDLLKKGGFWKWKRRKSMKKALVNPETQVMEVSSNPGTWEVRELVSRDGTTRLKALVFFASFDQRSEKAAGESACAAIVAVIAHRLQLNPEITLTGSEFDCLITEGSSEWRKLCKDESHKDFFPDQHFDFETILRSELRPLIVLPDNSRFGFFHPEEFDHLKGAKSFDEIWDEINGNESESKSRVYIVRWNDHFFIMKFEPEANYIIDSLGERLYEGCSQAYILKFDESSVMYSEEAKDRGEGTVICKGKECCKEYMKRFLAAIPVRDLKEQEAKGKTVDMAVLHQRLLIDFHLSTPSSSASTANSSITVSPNTSPPLSR